MKALIPSVVARQIEVFHFHKLYCTRMQEYVRLITDGHNSMRIACGVVIIPSSRLGNHFSLSRWSFVSRRPKLPTGLRPLGSARIKARGGKMPGVLAPLAVGALTKNIGTALIVAGAMNVAQELGPERMTSLGKSTAKKIAKVLRDAFRKRGWI